ncbi:MAG TPA: RNA polymerase sigma factor [Polyangiaceae bacterium]|nr:RNA polymerase sigma factor [Polyangiaceae bacterium]
MLPIEARAEEPLERIDLAMSRYADGDESAFADLFSALAPKLRAFLLRLAGSRELAEDLLQETFLRIHHARASFARGRRVTPWAYAIARNCYVSQSRSAQTRLARASGDLEIELPASPDTDAEQTALARQSAAVVQRTLAGMTEARREAFILLRYEGLSVAAAAQIVGVSESALKVRAFHAYELIRAALGAMTELGAASPCARERA